LLHLSDWYDSVAASNFAAAIARSVGCAIVTLDSIWGNEENLVRRLVLPKNEDEAADGMGRIFCLTRRF
jgi:hypothetical protein